MKTGGLAVGSVEKAGIIVVALLILIIAGVGLMNRHDAEGGATGTDIVASNSRTDVNKPRADPSRLTVRTSKKPPVTRKTNPRVNKSVTKPAMSATTKPDVKGSTLPVPAVTKPAIKKPTPMVTPVTTPKVIVPKALPPIPKTYTVKVGDVLSKIAYRTYGTTRMVAAIVVANPGINEDQLEVGQELKLPAMDPTISAAGSPSSSSRTSSPTAASRPATRPGFITAAYIASNRGGSASAKKSIPKGSYRVKSGDTISSIAQNQLGSVRHANRLVAANQTLLKNPNRLQVGWLIKLPAVN